MARSRPFLVQLAVAIDELHIVQVALRTSRRSPKASIAGAGGGKGKTHIKLDHVDATLARPSY